MWLAMPLIMISTLGLLRMIPGSIKPNIKKQFEIFKDKHTWSMSVLYILTFGSFIGFSMALPLSITVIFGFVSETGADGVVTRVANPNGPSALTYAWIGPFLGALTRPIGGWISDKWGGSLVTQVITVVMVLASIALGYVMQVAYTSAHPETYFFTFIALFLILFAASGLVMLDLPHHRVIYDREQAGPVLG